MQLAKKFSLVFFMALFVLIGLNPVNAQVNPAQKAAWDALPGGIGKVSEGATGGKGGSKGDAARAAQATIRPIHTRSIRNDIDSAAKFIGAGAATVGVAGSGGGIGSFSGSLIINKPDN